MSEKKPIDDNLHWYKDAIIYELHVKAFFDSNGDGIGDLKGLIQKLDYLEDLGITAIWLLPFYPSPLRDDGYDIADYYNINPAYGHVRDLKKLIKEAHKRGLKVITELVINHTSDQHPWFQRARKAAEGTEHRNYYVWSDDPRKYGDTRIIFTDTEPSNWTWDEDADAYYWHRFFAHQPDLNFDNPAVQSEVFRIMDFWCEIGVDGFRLDAVPYLFERENTNCENLPETHAFLKKLRAHIDTNHENKLLLAEANMWPEDSAAYFGDGDECHMNYHFPIMPRMFMALKMEDRYPVIDIIDQTPDIPESCQWAIFLRNHDELTLEMVTDEERDYMYKVYTKDPQARINVGIRHRLAPLLDNNRNKIELMNVLLFSLPGTPVIYYGDEIGMGDNFYLGDRDGVRTPMQWTADRNAGFSTANPHKLYLPTIIDTEYKYESVNVEAQMINGSSLLWWMKRVIAMRKKYKAFGRGDIKFLSPENAKVLAFTRSFKEEELLVICNLSRFPQAAELDLELFSGYTPVEVFSHNQFPPVSKSPYLFTLGPHGYYWFSMERDKDLEELHKIPELKGGTWKTLWAKRNLKKIETRVLPRYLQLQNWFSGKSRIIQDIRLLSAMEIPVEDLKTRLALVEITYNDGLPETYQVPLAFVSDNQSDNHIPEQRILARLEFSGETGLLIDAVYDERFRNAVFRYIRKGRKITSGVEELVFRQHKRRISGNNEALKSRVVDTHGTFSAIVYDKGFYLKIYRVLDNTINPDLEITKYLSDVSGYEQVPRFAGAVTYSNPSGGAMVLGMMQEVVTNQGTAWDYTMDSLQRFFERVLVHGRDLSLPKLRGNILRPMVYEELPQLMKELIGSAYPERISLLGRRTAELHQLLASKGGSPGFEQEPFSLHYQRSLFSSLQGLTRITYSTLQKQLKNLPEDVQDTANDVLGRKNEILKCFKRVYSEKFNALKIRTHGDYHLSQLLWTGRDFIIRNFEGEPMRPFSERRLKRSPLRDVASMIRSLHYAAYSAIFEQDFYKEHQELQLDKWARVWVFYNTRLFLNGYLNHIGQESFMPEKEAHYHILMDTFLLEKAIYELNFDLRTRPDWALVPMLGILSILNRLKRQ
jgi:maltose alpha-D-glucosyltransferase/alpha-amylase